MQGDTAWHKKVQGKGGSRVTEGAIGDGCNMYRGVQGYKGVQGQCRGHVGVQGCINTKNIERVSFVCLGLTLCGARDTRSCSWVQTNLARPSYFNKM